MAWSENRVGMGTKYTYIYGCSAPFPRNQVGSQIFTWISESVPHPERESREEQKEQGSLMEKVVRTDWVYWYQ